MPDDLREHCIFCDILRNEAPAHKIADNELSLAILDIQPLARGHCLVIPKRHVQWWHEMTVAETASLFTLAREVALRIERELRPEMVMIYARGKRIPHTHLFVVPTSTGDAVDRHFNALEGWQESAGNAAELADQANLARTADLLRTHEEDR
ncbi:MAG: HIT domain-containing protein [Candidatus Alcyoniella australis]|nr:HIT domain-containing protein [Candidatus Alcyoniella australis]